MKTIKAQRLRKRRWNSIVVTKEASAQNTSSQVATQNNDRGPLNRLRSRRVC